MADHFTKWPDCYDFDSMAKRVMEFQRGQKMTKENGSLIMWEDYLYLLREIQILQKRADANDDTVGIVDVAYNAAHDKLEERINKLEEYVNAHKALPSWDLHPLYETVKKLEEHHTRQIDENRKISRCVDEIDDNYITILGNAERRIENFEYHKNEFNAFGAVIAEKIDQYQEFHKDHYANHEQLKKEMQLIVQAQDNQCDEIAEMQQIAHSHLEENAWRSASIEPLAIVKEIAVETATRLGKKMDGIMQECLDKKTVNLTFEEAVEAIKNHKSIRRMSWSNNDYHLRPCFHGEAISWDDIIATDWMII